MTTATLHLVFDVASVTADTDEAPTYPVARDDGPGPVPAATTVLERHGWRLTGGWDQQAGGISGGVWTATVEA